MQPQIEPQTTLNYQSSQSPISPKKSSNSIIMPISSLVIAILGLIISIVSIIISIQNHETPLEITETAGTFEGEVVQVACNRPESANDIVYLYLSYNQDQTGVYISPEGTIDYYSKRINNNGETLTTNKGIITNTDSIFKQLFDEGIDEFSNYEYTSYAEEETNDTVDYNWRAEIDNADSSSCEVKGNDTPPTWFTKLSDLVNDKISQ